MTSNIPHADEDIRKLEKQYETLRKLDTSVPAIVSNDNRAASEICVSYFLKILPDVTSVIDVGSGAGFFLNAFKKRSIEVMGCDAHFPQGILEPDEFFQCDLGKPLPRRQNRFDLVLSLETAEHLPPKRGESFVDDLCRLSDIVIFGAAIPNQHGLGHVNEILASEWAARFQSRGYMAFDIIRPALWNDTRIPIWYRQNTILYINSARQESIKNLQKIQVSTNYPLDVCHPDFYSFRVNQYQEWLAEAQAKNAFYHFDLNELERLIKRLFVLTHLPKNAIGAELGVFRGYFSEFALDRLHPRRFYLVDPWTKLGQHWEWGKNEDYTSKGQLSTLAAKIEATNRSARFTSRTDVVIVEDFAENFLTDLKNRIAAGEAEPLDFVYLDSSHQYENTLRELKAAEPCLAINGLIAGDDWYADPNNMHHGVYKAVTEFVNDSDWEIVFAGQEYQYLLRRNNNWITASERHI